MNKISGILPSNARLSSVDMAKSSPLRSGSFSDPVEVLCPNNICSVSFDGKILYSDEHHLSIDGAKYLFEHISTIL